MANMKRVGDGTGTGSGPPAKQGLMSDEDKRPMSSRGTTTGGGNGAGPVWPKSGSGNRTTPLRGAK